MAKTKSLKPPAKIKVIKEKMTKSQILAALSKDSGVSKKEVIAVMRSLERLIEASIAKRSVGEFTFPGLMKIVTTHKPAVKSYKIIHPVTKDETIFKGKPASTLVHVKPLKRMKEFAN